MKNTLKIIIALLFSTLSWSQSIITRNNYFNIGDSVLIKHKFDIELVQFSNIPTGPNVIWDFSNMNFEHPSVIIDTISFKAPNGTPFFPNTPETDYSAANLCSLLYTDPFSSSNHSYSYYNITEEKIELIGQWANNPASEIWNDRFTNTITELQFPFTYLDNFQDMFHRIFYDNSLGSNVEINGSITVSADSYGTLILPNNQTIYNALRIHRHEQGTRISVEGVAFNHEQHSYTWYAPNMRGYLLKLNMSLNDPEQIDTADFVPFSILNTPNNVQNNIEIFPNPTQSIIKVITDISIKSIAIYNLSSQKILETNSIEIDLSILESGIYFLEVTDINNNLIRKKIIKE
ncbi:T9SS type A sorting domain-containing protein [Flavobacterium sp. TBRC 19031]|uniref:T9SS type A sorting domain-containing protein n=1 Tax=Flavobacterium mekongense TaxID=3379707 RepID=UPI003999F9E7